MSRLASSRNVQWSEEGATYWVYCRAQDLVNLSSLRLGYYDERSKKLNIFLRKMKEYIFGRNPKTSYFMTDTLMVQKVAYILASLCEGEWLSYLFSVLTKISYNLEENEKNSEKFFQYLYAQNNPERKNFDVIFSLKHSLQKPRTINETMKPIFGLGHEI